MATVSFHAITCRVATDRSSRICHAVSAFNLALRGRDRSVRVNRDSFPFASHCELHRDLFLNLQMMAQIGNHAFKMGLRWVCLFTFQQSLHRAGITVPTDRTALDFGRDAECERRYCLDRRKRCRQDKCRKLLKSLTIFAKPTQATKAQKHGASAPLVVADF